MYERIESWPQTHLGRRGAECIGTCGRRVGTDGFRDILGVVEGAKEDKESWAGFLRHLKERGLKGVQLVISDKCLGLVKAAEEFYPQALWRRDACAIGNHDGGRTKKAKYFLH